jgi:FMN phosphatase YigB (HAD superfamily)
MRYFGDLITAGAPSLWDVAVELGAAVYDAYNPGARWTTFPDVREALTMLNEAGFQLHIVSDWDSTLPEILEIINLDRFFRESHISAQLRLAKSGPEIYTMALQRAGLAASEVVMIGDSCPRDVEIPRTIGIAAIFIDRNQIGPCCQAVATFPDLKHAALYIQDHYVPKGYSMPA